MSQLLATRVYIVDEEAEREQICLQLEQKYWADNGDEADGNAYLIEIDDLPEGYETFLIYHGTRIDGYVAEEHATMLNKSGFPWTGWQTERYALVQATLDMVQKALSHA